MGGGGLWVGLGRAEEALLLMDPVTTEGAPLVEERGTTQDLGTTEPVSAREVAAQPEAVALETQPVPLGTTREADVLGTVHLRDGSVTMTDTTRKTMTLLNPPVSKEAPATRAPFVPVPPVDGVADRDGDGIPDEEEIRRGTNPEVIDTDGDGYSDGDEVKSGYNPLKYSVGDKGDKIEFQSPQENVALAKQQALQSGKAYVAPPLQDNRYTVEKIERITRETGGGVIRFSGKALPNQLVTVYVFSDPIVVVVKADKDGNWSYDLEKDLDDGDHEAYVAVTDNVGKITAQSSALPFVKTAQAVSLKPLNVTPTTTSPVERSKTSFFVTALLLIISFLSLGGVLVRYFSRNGTRN